MHQLKFANTPAIKPGPGGYVLKSRRAVELHVSPIELIYPCYSIAYVVSPSQYRDGDSLCLAIVDMVEPRTSIVLIDTPTYCP